MNDSAAFMIVLCRRDETEFRLRGLRQQTIFQVADVHRLVALVQPFILVFGCGDPWVNTIRELGEQIASDFGITIEDADVLPMHILLGDQAKEILLRLIKMALSGEMHNE